MGTTQADSASNRIAAPSVSVLGLVLDAERARSHVDRIQHHLAQVDHHLSDARQLIWELKEYGGWKALGYKSWRECVQAEFEQSSASIYRQLGAALVELDISPTGRIGEVNERVLRPLTRRQFDAQSRQLVWDISHEIVGEGGRVTSGVVEAVVEGLKDMLASGALQDSDGNQLPITDVMKSDLTARVREVKLAHKQHKQDIQHLDAKRTYILGGLPVEDVQHDGGGHVRLIVHVDDSLILDNLYAAKRRMTLTEKPIYISLWTEG